MPAKSLINPNSFRFYRATLFWLVQYARQTFEFSQVTIGNCYTWLSFGLKFVYRQISSTALSVFLSLFLVAAPFQVFMFQVNDSQVNSQGHCRVTFTTCIVITDRFSTLLLFTLDLSSSSSCFPASSPCASLIFSPFLSRSDKSLLSKWLFPFQFTWKTFYCPDRDRNAIDLFISYVLCSYVFTVNIFFENFKSLLLRTISISNHARRKNPSVQLGLLTLCASSRSGIRLPPLDLFKMFFLLFFLLFILLFHSMSDGRRMQLIAELLLLGCPA